MSRRSTAPPPATLKPATRKPAMPSLNPPPVMLSDDPLSAAATLLPQLDAEAASGHAPSHQAATLIRMLLSRGTPAPTIQPGEKLPQAVQRLATLVREQDRQLDRLHAMLDALL